MPRHFDPTWLPESTRAWQTILLVTAVAVVNFLWRLYRARSHMRRLQREGMPMPPHHWLFGHIGVAAKIFRSLPPHAHLLLIADQVRREYPNLDTAFYLDIWPFGPPTLMVISPDLASQFTQDASLPKFEGLRKFLEPLTGKKDLVSMEGQEWRHWRSKFNPGFSAANILSMIPAMVEEFRGYRDVIYQHALTGDIIPLELPTLALSMDIIGRVVLDQHFHSQKSFNSLTAGMVDQVAWCEAGLHSNPFQYLNIARPFVQRYNTWRMNSYLDPVLRQRYATIRQRPKSKFIADLIMSTYIDPAHPDKHLKTVDSDFEFMRSQVKLFLQAGHDTTAASIVFTLYLLSKHPAALSRLRAELDTVFGGPETDACALLTEKPHLLNNCPFLHAVVKETLRVYPPTASARAGQPNFFLADGDKRLPTERCLVVSNHFGIHHNPRFWPRADEFVAERWLVAEGDPLYPVKNGWRPFERGPRNCLGQELALTEIRLVVALVVREFEVLDAYEECDAKKGLKRGSLEVNGERVYQIMRGGGQPSENFPCRLRLRTKEYGG
ncbi:hypothetical protein VTI74DRAFT_967 [Chaetomium olivicolor]